MHICTIFTEPSYPPVLIYSRWEERSAGSCRLRLCVTNEEAETLQSKLPLNEAREVSAQARGLPGNSKDTGFQLNGALASMFTGFVNEFLKHPVDAVILDQPQVIGSWGPPPNLGLTDAAIVWYTPEDGFRVAIAYSVTEAVKVLRSFDWDEEREARIGRAEKWALPRTGGTALMLKGPVARLLGTAALVEKQRRGAKSRAN